MTAKVETGADRELLERQLERAIRARQEAERLAEEKTAELYESKRDLELISAATQRAGATSGVDDAMTAALEAVCEQTGWQLGHAYRIDGAAQRLEPTDLWIEPGPGTFPRFKALTMRTEFRLGEGIPGRAAATGEVIWIEDVREEPGLPRFPDDDVELRGAVAVPVAVAGTPYAVLEFFSAARLLEGLERTGPLATIARNLGQTLERNLAREQLAEHARRLEEANADLREFAYVASHDLSEPLRTISGFVQLLRTRYEGSLDETADEFIGYVVGGTERMQKLIEDLLLYSRVGRGELREVPVDPARIIERITASYAHAIGRSGARIEIEGELPELRGDPSQIERLFANLISNSIKYRSEDPPRIVFRARRAERDRVEIELADNGIGIEPRHAERIFKVFHRLHTAEEYPGTGIGLSICRKICERHEGRISAAPGEEGGSVFRFDLPAATAPLRAVLEGGADV